MLATTIRTPPKTEHYTPLAEYQSQTPESFVGGKPVLHHQVVGAKAWIPKEQCGTLAVFPADLSTAPTAPEADGSSEALVEQKVDIFVTSENFIIFSPQIEAGVSIPYPSISIHAVKQVGPETDVARTQAVWMQLEFSEGGSDDDDFNTVELTLISPPTHSASKLYEAMAKCSELHPDPNAEDEDEEEDYDRIVFEGSAEYEAMEGFPGVMRGEGDGLPPPMPGSGGWITAENVNQFFDEEGNWLGRGGEEAEDLGEGAGRVRAREEVEGAELNGHGSNDDPENKRPRVD